MSDEILWAIGRGTGAVALVLLTLSVALGIQARSGKKLLGTPRFAVANIHRSVSLLSLVFTLLHVTALLFDQYAKLNLAALFIPFTARSEPFWNGLGAIALDLLLALAITGLLRNRIGEKTFRLIHWGAYACWPVALAHGVGIGTDSADGWFLALTLSCLALVSISLIYRFSLNFTGYSRARQRAQSSLNQL